MKFIKKLAIKVIKTMSQSAVGVLTGCAILSQIDWCLVGSTALVSGILCVLMNLSDLKEPEE